MKIVLFIGGQCIYAKRLVWENYKNNYSKIINAINISENDRNEILKIIDSIFFNEIGYVIKNTDFELEDKISSLIAVDQYFRVNYDPNFFEVIDSQYIFAGMMDLMLTDNDLSHLSKEGKASIFVILLHQSDYIEQFNKMCDLDLIEKMLNENVISPIEYAVLYDRNSVFINEKMKYGTLYTWGYYKSWEGFDLEEINTNRLKIGLCELQYDYRNAIPIIDDKNEMKKQILERLNALNSPKN